MTLSTLVRKKSALKWSAVWGIIAIFCGVFSLIYEFFSHGVYSNAMIYLFAFPLLLGAVPCFLLEHRSMAMPNRFFQDGVLMITLASLLSGILEIYGTSSDYTRWFFIAGIAVYALGVIGIFTQPKQA